MTTLRYRLLRLLATILLAHAPFAILPAHTRGQAPAAQADLSITKTLGQVLANNGLVYSVRWRNNGPDASGPITMTDRLPAGLLLTGLLEQNTLCTEAGGRITCTSALAADEQAGVDIYTDASRMADGAPIANTAQIAGSLPDPNPANNRSSIVVTKDGQVLQQAYLPMTQSRGDGNNAPLPDLVATNIGIGPAGIALVIRNTGAGAASREFWVDLNINNEPRKVNETWDAFTNGRGATWLVPSLAAGQTLTLTVGDVYYRAANSKLPASVPTGTALWLHVDSADTLNPRGTGAIEETHERANGAYDTAGSPINNIRGVILNNQVNFNLP